MKILISSFFPFSFSHKKKKTRNWYIPFLFANTKECGRSGAESEIWIWNFHSPCNYTTALKFILITIFIFYAPNQTCHMMQVWRTIWNRATCKSTSHRETPCHSHLHRSRHSIDFNGSFYRHVHPRLHSVHHGCLSWHRHRALLFIWYAKECCGAAPRSLLKYFTPHITQSGSGGIRMSSKSEVAPSR